MHLTLRLLTFPTLWLALNAAAQTPTTPPETPVTLPMAPHPERITHEDALSRIDELRVGGQTQRIDVQPKNGAPAYHIQTGQGQPTGLDSASQPAGNAGRSSWRILSF
ncbi:MAG: hypothetical protein Q8K34_09725 [Hydrogenophaga sp.]|jgi:hypothetical protein|uniref:hypothetical protein n=1 Tax=Hydrogenophaga sp. TaxID=1904254 RepID=UPI002722E628|nr:hypothetical protein [Hydrogenophaga sp.]MDO9567761.1 hypothetical protein [Hydrogenophaga sp.]MDP2220463.1 hypothetical protein [Hydrogenophaga sp.]MDP3346374.1 hypothetical protein [Hydrogenophaga sp.]MDP3375489.1 hypothetical protein [Hydrogenophaga sp.]MDP3809170.1 hypothetical protein [Hydrogenophaga sp.]